MTADKEDDTFDKIAMFASEDENLKFLGELLSNESSRKILLLLTIREMTANEIAEKTDIRLSLVIHHLKKMQKINLVKVSKVEKNSKNHDLKYYLAKQGMLILPKNSASQAKKSKAFSSLLNRIIRYSAIGIISITSGIITELQMSTEKFTDPTYPVPIHHTDSTLPIAVSLTIIVIGLIIEISFFIRNKKY